MECRLCLEVGKSLLRIGYEKKILKNYFNFCFSVSIVVLFAAFKITLNVDKQIATRVARAHRFQTYRDHVCM